MSPLRNIKCPRCGVRHYIGHPCNREIEPQRSPRAARVVVMVLVMMVMTLVLTAAAFFVADRYGRGAGIAVVFGVWLLVWLCRLGYEFEDGIDVVQLMFPAPFDWPVKFERLIHFWTNPRAWFRIIYVASALALIIVGLALARRGP